MGLVLFAAGLAVLLVSGDILARMTLLLARRLGFAPITIALTITSLATSAPEALVCIEAAWRGAGDIALGNVVGSNIANVWLVLGAAALLAPLASDGLFVRRNAIFALLASLLAAALGWSGWLTRPAGGVLLVLALAYFAYALHLAQTQKTKDQNDGKVLPAGSLSLLFAAPLFLLAAAGLHYGAGWTIDGALLLARALAVPDAVIALTLVALGTSLPELATSLAAARAGRSDIALGNVLGSNVMNVLLILPLALLASPLAAGAGFLLFDFPVMILASLSILPVLLLRGRFSRLWAGGFLLSYALYISLLSSWH